MNLQQALEWADDNCQPEAVERLRSRKVVKILALNIRRYRLWEEMNFLQWWGNTDAFSFRGAPNPQCTAEDAWNAATAEAEKDMEIMRDQIEYMETQLEPMLSAEREKWATVCDWFDAQNPHIGQASELAKMLRANAPEAPNAKMKGRAQ